MKHEHRKAGRRASGEGGFLDARGNQGVSGIREDDRLDLRDAVCGEYRFQGTLVRAFYLAGCTWFVGAEVCETLEIVNPRDALSRLEDDEKGVGIIDTAGGPQTINLINESAIYSLIFKSRKPQARAFRRWVTGEVLPQIRQTGAYAVQGHIEGNGSILLPHPDKPARFIVMAAPGETPHIRRTAIGDALTEFTALDRQAMCYTLKQIEVWWNKVQTKASVRVPHDDGFAINKLDETIRNGSEMADHFLDVAP
ncbi:MAG: Bro-N domain-containing protein [Rhodospirillales bacterium]|nr:Bro-N domain-containing protein [Rhodospirillales bacterium]